MSAGAAHDLLARWLLIGSALTDERLTGGDRACLWAVLDRMDATGVCWPSLGTIAADAKVSRGTAVRAIARLVEHGFLVRESGTRTTSNRYRIGTPARCTPEPRRGDEPRCMAEPRVGAGVSLGVGAGMSLELTQLNLPNEPTQEAAAAAQSAVPGKRPPKKKTKKIGFREWLDSLSDEQQEAEEERVHAYIEKIGAPEEFADLFLQWTVDTWSGDTGKVQASWPRTIDLYLRNAWHRLWAPSREGGFYLTTAGEQLRREIAADRSQPVRDSTNQRHRELL